jgi:hypothetical protein
VRILFLWTLLKLFCFDSFKFCGVKGYFRIAQTEKGPYGLFAVLLHGIVPDSARNVTGQVYEDPSASSDRLGSRLLPSLLLLFCGTTQWLLFA